MAAKFTHAADAAAKIVVQNALFFARKKLSDLVMPWCTYTSPGVARVGIYAHEAAQQGIDQVLGATIVASHAGETISQITQMILTKAGLGTLSNVIFPYPTQSEALKRAAGLHQLDCAQLHAPPASFSDSMT